MCILSVDSVWWTLLPQNIQCTLKTAARWTQWISYLKLICWKWLMEGRLLFHWGCQCQSICVRCPSAAVPHTISTQPQRGISGIATFVTPVTSCRRHLINGVGCGCQRTSVSSYSNIQVCLCLHPPPTPTSPSVRTLSPALLIGTVWHWQTVWAAQNEEW